MTCLFCRIVAGEEPAEVVLETGAAVGFLDTRPVFKGHVLVVPRHHIPTLTDLPDDQVAPLFTDVRAVAAAVRGALGAQGTFVAMNNVVSQSVPHLHVHVVPRTKGDGLRGFFWPRTRYAEGEAAGYAARVRAALGDSAGADGSGSGTPGADGGAHGGADATPGGDGVAGDTHRADGGSLPGTGGDG